MKSGRVYPQGRCKACNSEYMARYRVSNRDTGIGMMRDSAENLRRAAAYLDRNK